MEVEEMVAGLAEWEKEARRAVYRYMEGEWDIDINAFLAVKIGTSEGWNALPEFCPKDISDYYSYMEGDAIQDRQAGYDATFAIDFIRMVKDLLHDWFDSVNALAAQRDIMELRKAVTDYLDSIEKFRTYDSPPFEQNWFELVGSLVEPTLKMQGDTEDGIREWLLGLPEVNERFLPDANGLWIERIS